MQRQVEIDSFLSTDSYTELIVQRQVENKSILFYSIDFISKLGLTYSSLRQVYAPRFHPVGDWNSKVDLKSSLSGVLKWNLEQLVDI